MVLVMVSHKYRREISLRTQLPLETYSIVAPCVVTPSVLTYIFLSSPGQRKERYPVLQARRKQRRLMC